MGSRNSKSTVFEDTFEAAKKTAYKMLSRRDRTAHEIAQKLKEKGFSEATISETISSLKEVHLLDDLRFARGWARFRLESSHFGVIRLRRELLEKGIPPGDLDNILCQVAEEFDLISVAEAALSSRYKDLAILQDRTARRRAFDFLRRRGHPTENILRLFKKVGVPVR